MDKEIMEMMDKAPQLVELATRLKTIKNSVYAVAAIGSFMMFFYSWYLVLSVGFSLEVGVSMALALLFGLGMSGMVST